MSAHRSPFGRHRHERGRCHHFRFDAGETRPFAFGAAAAGAGTGSVAALLGAVLTGTVAVGSVVTALTLDPPQAIAVPTIQPAPPPAPLGGSGHTPPSTGVAEVTQPAATAKRVKTRAPTKPARSKPPVAPSSTAPKTSTSTVSSAPDTSESSSSSSSSRRPRLLPPLGGLLS